MFGNFTIKAINSDRYYGYTKGVIYDFVDGSTKWDDGLGSGIYKNYEDFCNRNISISEDFILIYEESYLTVLELLNELINKNVNIGDKFECSNGDIYEVVLINNNYYTLYKIENYKEIQLSLLLSNNITFKKIENEE